MSFLNNGYTGEQGASNITMQSSSRDSTAQSSKRGNSGAGTYSGVTKNSRSNRNPPALQSIASTQAVHQPDLWETINSIVSPKEVKAGQQGDNKRPRANIRWEGMNLFGWVDGAWKPAAYHVAFREKLILRDAEQLGAPVWQKGMSLDFTSYSPLMLGWSADPDSIQDSKGRLVCRMERPPMDWSHNPRSGYLVHDGLVMLDQNNRPIKNFLGAPRTLKGTAPPWEIEGLRRSLGMTYWDIRARMPPVRNTDKGRKRLQTYTYFSNCVGHWIKEVNEAAGRRIMVPWQTRAKSKPADETDNDESSQQAEEDEDQEEELVLPMAYNDAAEDPISHPYPSSSTVNMSTMPEQTSWEGNHLNIPTFPGANQFSQTTNTVPSDSIYIASYSPAFPPSNIYSSAGNPYDFAPADQYPSPHNPNPGTYLRAQTANTVASDSIHSAGYAPALVPSSIYTAANYPFHLPQTDGYSSPYKYNNPTTTAPDIGGIPIFTNSTAMTPWNNWTQPDYSCRQNLDQAWQGETGLHRPDLPAHHEPSPPTVASQDTQPIATATSLPVLPEENANITFSSPEEDPFMGADWSPEMTDEWQ